MSQNKYAESHVDGVSHRGKVERVLTRVSHNDWSALEPPGIGRWRPYRSVSVIIPARGGQERLDLTLACLAGQTYPEDLLEVVVVDDHSSPPLRLPRLRPGRCRLLPAPEGGRGAGYARAYGAHASTGDILLWLDADMVVDRDFVEAQVRWHHVHAETVTLGRVRFADTAPGSPAEVLSRIRAGTLHEQFGPCGEHDWVERLLRVSNDLRESDHLGFHAYIGAAAALRRSLYEAAGGVDPDLDLGQDTEFGYRLWQAGAVMVPEPAATAWHIGGAGTARTRLPSARYRTEVLAELMPHPHAYRERVPVHRRRVPLVRAVVDVSGAPYDLVRDCVDRLLAGAESDLVLTLVADWEGTGSGAPGGPRLDLRLIQANYLREPRVGFASAMPRTGFPSPFLLQVPVTWGLGQVALSRMLAGAERSRAGLTELLPAGPALPGSGVRLWRTRALARALRVRRAGEDLGDVVTEVHGRYRIHAGAETLTDLSLYRPVPPLPRTEPDPDGLVLPPAPEGEEDGPPPRQENRRGPGGRARAARGWLRSRLGRTLRRVRGPGRTRD
ncbi:glycosyltransferase [Nocardiopsis algeriensis]|uniref:GT2 family glycosyltransferase n=1 Tax=Nocardiopsis algeriensis TaxID=1478215 RepID=A0A841IP20_9ACTN|nr:GT2 family glycosyltransferase [Nocardiopsis algeriensis]